LLFAITVPAPLAAKTEKTTLDSKLENAAKELVDQMVNQGYDQLWEISIRVLPIMPAWKKTTTNLSEENLNLSEHLRSNIMGLAGKTTVNIRYGYLKVFSDVDAKTDARIDGYYIKLRDDEVEFTLNVVLEADGCQIASTKFSVSLAELTDKYKYLWDSEEKRGGLIWVIGQGNVNIRSAIAGTIRLDDQTETILAES
jgi:hypothetical protein